MSDIAATTIVGAGAFVVGSVFGWTAQKTNFCTMGAISDIVFMGDWRRFRAWMLAVAVAIIGTQTLQLTGLVNIGKSIYLTPNLGWAGAILGGAMFGFGMTMAGGCGNKTLVRIGGGNLKSVIVFLVLGFFSYMTLRGLIALGRIQMEALNLNLASLGLASQGMPDILAKITGLPAATARMLLTALVGGGLALWCFKDAEFRGSGHDVIGGLVIGLLIVGGWAVSGILGADEFEPLPVTSFTFVAPIGGAMQYLMSFTGATIDFGIAAVGGVIFGSFLAARTGGSFQLESFTGTDDLLRHLLGAALMGTGGVLALGCTVGQGITGMSTLALSAPIALGSIVFGGVLGMKYLEEGTLPGALKAVFGRA
ncbi:YeeE/YedE family protein [Magnetospirillum sp. SS-4]|uniref:YeeE/YedE family protein n=1 Tax=Magnetospirillum sp. SS-4 TaxID=2681465 RepID=UPI001381548D|nr:YeeE/YedE family protein [Magnetospirillum sp. SS-4]CAA7612458.1 YeeE/YedE [Magnetospirillum sp. SS-4]